MSRWIWICPILVMLLSVTVFFYWGWSWTAAGLVALVMVLPAIMIFGSFQIRKTHAGELKKSEKKSRGK